MGIHRMLTAGLACVMLLAGCAGGRNITAAPADAGGLGWPPPEAAPRAASDYATSFNGVDHAAMGGNTGRYLDSLDFIGGGELPWAVYAVGSLGTSNELVSVAAEFVEQPGTPGDGTQLYFAIANHAAGRWEWIDAPTAEQPWLCPAGLAADYRSAGGSAHLAVVLSGPGLARLATVTFNHQINPAIVPSPQHLVATGTAPSEIQLDWDAVPNTNGYNVYRALHNNIAEMYKINGALVTENSYTDTTCSGGNYYFYFVKAVAANESGPSNFARAWCFGVDLPAPANLHVSARGSNNFTVSWEWTTANPYAFLLMIDRVPDFLMDSETMQQTTTFKSARDNTFFSIEPGLVYYVKMAAVASLGGLPGRISDEVAGSSTGFWTWGEFETIGTGEPPVRAIVADGTIAVTYFNASGVDFAIQDGEDWRVETPLPSNSQMVGDTNPVGSFADYQDLCYGGGYFLISSYGYNTGDCWVATWDTSTAPDTWLTKHIHGDGQTTVGGKPAPKSGLHVAVAASDTEFAVVQYYLTNLQLIMHTRDIAGATWTESLVKDTYTAGATLSNCLVFKDDNLFLLTTDNYSDELLFGDRTGGYSLADVRDASCPKLAKFHDLQWFDGEWYTPAMQTSDKDLYLVHGDSLPWIDNPMATLNAESGYEARLAVDGTEATVIERSGGKYNFALSSDSWLFYPINVPGVSDYGTGADVVMLDGLPYIVFQDEATGEIKIAKGSPPV